MDSNEFTYWQAYDLINPIGEERQDSRIATLCALLQNVHSASSDRKTPNDFIKMWKHVKSEVVEQTPEDIDTAVDDFIGGMIEQKESE
jgi:hypothetical protein